MPQISKLCLTGGRCGLSQAPRSPPLLRLPWKFPRTGPGHHHSLPLPQVEGNTQSTNPGLQDSLQGAAPAVSPAAVPPAPDAASSLRYHDSAAHAKTWGSPLARQYPASSQPKWAWGKLLPICTGSETPPLWPSSVWKCSAAKLLRFHHVTALSPHPNKQTGHRVAG